MTELPERIWACMGGPMVGMFVSGGNNGGWPEYVRADAIEALTAERDRLREALAIIDAIDPEHHIDGCALTVVRGLVLRMGETARAALKGETP